MAIGTSRLPRDTLYLQKLALTSLTNGGRLVCIVRLLTRAKEFIFLGYVELKTELLHVASHKWFYMTICWY
jgi:hypothetical protein